MSSSAENLTFRLAGTNDLPELFELMPLYYEADHLVFEKAKAERALRTFFADRNLGSLWFIDLNGKSIGYIALCSCYSLEFGGREAFVDELFVLPEHQGKGYGTRALKYALEESRKAGLRAVRLEVTPTNPRALKLYESIGFQNLGRSLLAYELN